MSGLTVNLIEPWGIENKISYSWSIIGKSISQLLDRTISIDYPLGAQYSNHITFIEISFMVRNNKYLTEKKYLWRSWYLWQVTFRTEAVAVDLQCSGCCCQLTNSKVYRVRIITPFNAVQLVTEWYNKIKF